MRKRAAFQNDPLPGKREGRTMKWEYLILQGPYDQKWCRNHEEDESVRGKTLAGVLNTLGGDGWELVAVWGDHYTFYFKKPIR
jgi:hypothetical protein